MKDSKLTFSVNKKSRNFSVFILSCLNEKILQKYKSKIETLSLTHSPSHSRLCCSSKNELCHAVKRNVILMSWPRFIVSVPLIPILFLFLTTTYSRRSDLEFVLEFGWSCLSESLQTPPMLKAKFPQRLRSGSS